jgi:hypothetical protein
VPTRTALANLHHWEIIRHGGDRWTWEMLSNDGSVLANSGNHFGFGPVIQDAVANGFLAKGHDWIVREHDLITHFKAGHDPVVTLAPDAGLQAEKD